MRFSRRFQRGFLYLTTGANGAGKTLNTLKWVRDRQLAENRPVYYNGRFELTAEFGWEKIEFADWQKCPDGSIILLDECHNDLPVRKGGAPVPDEVKMLAEHRRRGFDFYLITQHPQNIDLFVRRLIGSPGWHRHLKRTFGVDMVSVLEWAAVNDACEKNGSGKTGKVSMVAFPKEVYKWYKSASLHTGKKSIPKQVYYLAVLVPLIAVLGWFAFQKLMPKPPPSVVPLVTPAGVSMLAGGRAPGGSSAARPLTTAEFVASYEPRIPGLAHTAPRYDDVQKVAQAPKPAACIDGTRPGSGKRSCECWTQQATVLPVPDFLCRQIAAGGYFDDTLQPVQVAQAASFPLASSGQTQSSPDAQGVTLLTSSGYGVRDAGFLKDRNASTVSSDDSKKASSSKSQN